MFGFSEWKELHGQVVLVTVNFQYIYVVEVCVILLSLKGKT